MLIRKAEVTDLPQILTLYAQPDMDNGKILSVDDARKIFERMNSYPDYCIYIAELDGSVVGTFALAIMDNLAHLGSKTGLIEDVVVSADFQGKGIGTQMMKHAIQICKDKSCYKVCLSSNIKRESAHGFYQNIGFKIHGYSFLTDIE